MKALYKVFILVLLNIYMLILLSDSKEQTTLLDNTKVNEQALLDVSVTKVEGLEVNIKEALKSKNIKGLKDSPYFKDKEGVLDISFYDLDVALNELILIIEENREIDLNQRISTSTPIADRASDEYMGEEPIDFSEIDGVPTYVELVDGLTYETFIHQKGVLETVFILDSQPTSAIVTLRWVGGVLHEANLQRY